MIVRAAEAVADALAGIVAHAAATRWVIVIIAGLDVEDLGVVGLRDAFVDGLNMLARRGLASFGSVIQAMDDLRQRIAVMIAVSRIECQRAFARGMGVVVHAHAGDATRGFRSPFV